MYSEYIQLPKYMEMQFCSYILQDFIKNVTIRDNKIDLDYLRHYYLDKNSNFIILRDELLLRGCKFVIKKENNLIYNYNFDISDNDKVIYVNNNRMKYQKLNTILFNYLDYSQIKNDKYFNYIPLKYIAYVNKIDNIKLVENEFAKLGFTFKYIGGLPEIRPINKDIDLEKIDLESYIFNKSLENYHFIDRHLEEIKNKDIGGELDIGVFLRQKLIKKGTKEDLEGAKLLSRFSINTIEDYLCEDYESLREILNIMGDDKAHDYIKKLNDLILEELLRYASLNDLMKNINQLLTLFRNSSFCRKNFPISDREKSISLVGLGPSLKEKEDNIIFRKDIFQAIISDYRKIDIEYLEEKNITTIFSYMLRAAEEEIKDKKKLDDFILSKIEDYSYGIGMEIVPIDFKIDEIIKEDIGEQEETTIDKRLNKNFLANKSNTLYRRIMKSISLLDLIEFDSSMADKKIQKALKQTPSIYDYYLNAFEVKIKSINGVGIKGRKNFKQQLYKIYISCLEQIERLNESILIKYKLKKKEGIENYSDYILYKMNNENFSSTDFLDANEDMLCLMNPDLARTAPELFRSILKLRNIDIKEGPLEEKRFKDALDGLYDYKKFEDNRSRYSKLENIWDEREIMVLEGRIIAGKTLEVCGDNMGVTRERVRQIEKKAIKKLSEDKELIDFLFSLKLFGKKFYGDELRLILNNGLLFELLKSNIVDNVYYSELTNSFYLSDLEDIKPILSSMSNIKEDMGDYGYYEEIQETILSIYPEVSDWELEHIIDGLKITTIGEYYYSGNLNNGEYMDMYFKYINPSRVRIDEETLEDFQKEITGYFGFQYFLSRVRNISATIDRVDNIIMVDRRTYQHIDYCGFSSDEVELAEEVLKKSISEEKRLNSEDLYELFINTGIKNLISSYHAYFLVKYYFFEDYVFSDKNSMTLFKNEEVKLSNIEIIKKCLKGHDYPIKMKHLAKEVNITEQRTEITISNNRDSSLVKMCSKIGLAEKIFDGVDYKYLKETLDKSFESGYTTTNLIYNKFSYDPKLAGLLEKNKIEKPKELAGIIKNVKPEIKGNNMFLYLEESPIKSMYDLMAYKYKKEVARKEIIDVLVNELAMDQQNVSIVIEKLVEEYNYVQVGVEEFINESYLDIDGNLKDLVLTLAQNYESEGFIVPNRMMEENKMDFLSLKARENQYIISYILKNNGYKKLRRYSISYLQEILVLVKEDSEYVEIQDLVYDKLKNDYMGKLLEEDIYDYLAELGIYGYKEYRGDKKLLQDVLNENKITVDWAGRVDL